MLNKITVKTKSARKQRFDDWKSVNESKTKSYPFIVGISGIGIWPIHRESLKSDTKIALPRVIFFYGHSTLCHFTSACQQTKLRNNTINQSNVEYLLRSPLNSIQLRNLIFPLSFSPKIVKLKNTHNHQHNPLIIQPKGIWVTLIII